MPYKGTTIRVKTTIKDFDGNLLDPDSQEVRIYDSKGNEVSGSPFSPTKVSEGVYFVDYVLSEDAEEGTWKVVWKIVKSNKPSIGILTFDVEGV